MTRSSQCFTRRSLQCLDIEKSTKATTVVVCIGLLLGKVYFVHFLSNYLNTLVQKYRSGPQHKGVKPEQLTKAVCTEAMTVTAREEDYSWGFPTPLLPWGSREGSDSRQCILPIHGESSGKFLCLLHGLLSLL